MKDFKLYDENQSHDKELKRRVKLPKSQLID